MSTLEWVTIVVVIVLILGWYLSYSAARLDRLHARVESTSAALDAQLVRRAEATLEMANAGHLDAASGLILASAAAESLATVRGRRRPGGGRVRPHRRAARRPEPL